MPPLKHTELEEHLAKLRRAGEERSAERRAQNLGYAYVDLAKVPVSTDSLKLIEEKDAREAKVAAIESKTNKVALAAFDPRLRAAAKVIENLEAKKYEVKTFIASLSGLEQIWSSYKFVKKRPEGITGKVTVEDKQLENLTSRLKNFATAQKEIASLDFTKVSPALILETVLASALALKASDIHFESGEKAGKIRLRVDGLLHDIFGGLPLKNNDSLSSRIKLLAGLKINVRSESQDGRFTINFGKKEIEIRVSVIPSEFGENIVMRILDPDVIAIDLRGLGLREDDLIIAKREIAKPNGLILNTGPTGSGKTTTLYAFLKQLNNPEIKIITLEDPIEYRIAGIEQTQVDPKANYTFANGLRAIVRQDPDVILVGEVRDLETADIALQASLTGHLVFSTLHTNDAIGAVPRLVNLGVKTISIGPALNLIIAQRLVRKLCPDCKKITNPSEELKKNIEKFFAGLPRRVDRSQYSNYKIYKAVGCERCNFGYRGRIGIFEFFEGGLALEEVILKEASEISLKKLAEAQGMVTMQEDGVLKTLRGETSFEEVESATGEIDWSR